MNGDDVDVTAADAALEAADASAGADDEADAGAAEREADAGEHPRSKRKKRKGQTAAQTMGGVLFGFEQQVWRTAPPPIELVRHARPDASVPAGDGSFLTITMPDGVDLADDDDAEEPR